MEYNKSHFFSISLIFFLLVVNFFMTPSPFSAMHSGKISFGVEQGYYIVPAYLILFGMIVSFLYKFKIKINIFFIVLLFLSVVGGFFNGGVFFSLKSYIYDFIILFLLAVVFQYNSKMTTILDKRDKFNIILNFAFTMVLLGLTLAILFPQKYGYLPFGFSRESRGQVTLWLYGSLYIVYPALATIGFLKYKLRFHLMFSIFVSLVILSTASRVPLLISLVPFLLLIVYFYKRIFMLLSLVVGLMALSYYKKIFDFFSSIFYVEDFSNGRSELWQYYWSSFVENPFFGKGLSFMQYQQDYFGKAESEIGLLKIFAERGIFFGLFFLLMVIISVYMAHINIKNKNIVDNFTLFISFIFLSLFISLFQSYSRIYSFDDFLFWLSLFYLFSQWCFKLKLRSLEFRL